MYRFIVFMVFLTGGFGAIGQEKATLSGYVRDAANGEALIGATVMVKATGNGTTTNVYGFYSITLPKATYEVDFSFVGYARQLHTVNLDENIRLDIELTAQSNELQEVVVMGTAERSMVESVEMSVNKIDIKTITRIPAFLGEVDVIRSLQQLPGITSVGEGASGFNARGGNVGQNLILLDEATVYNSSHMLGFFLGVQPGCSKRCATV